MKRVFLYVEGQTEETFVRDILRPHLAEYKIDVIAVVASTKRTSIGIKYIGGITSYSKVKREIIKLLNDKSVIRVTTMLDYYGLPKDFPGKADKITGSPYEKVNHVEKAFSEDINDPFFFHTLPFMNLRLYFFRIPPR